MKLFSSRIVATAFFLTLFLSGCILPQKRKVIAPQPGKDPVPHPPALAQWQRESTVRFLLVHGMGNHPFGEGPKLLGNPTYRALAEELKGWDALPPKRKNDYAEAARFQFSDFIEGYAGKAGLTEPNPADTDFRPIETADGRVTGYRFKRTFQARAGGGRQVIFYVTSWALSAAVEKERIYGSWDGLTKPRPAIDGEVGDFDAIIDRPRHSLNRMLKHNLVDWGITDAALYVGPMGGEMEWTVAKAMDAMALELQPGDRAAVVTASLGSTIAYNAMVKLLNNRPIDGRRFSWTGNARENLRGLFFPSAGQKDGGCSIAFYMFANQYGLLTAGQGRVHPATDKTNPVNMLQAAVSAAQSAAPPRGRGRTRVRRPVELVAFTDPDDLLSFGMPGKQDGVATMNVYVRNNKWVIYVPVLGSASDPLNAHGGYGRNPVVLDIMLNGADKYLPPR